MDSQNLFYLAGTLAAFAIVYSSYVQAQQKEQPQTVYVHQPPVVLRNYGYYPRFRHGSWRRH